jgi:hypothetical protein
MKDTQSINDDLLALEQTLKAKLQPILPDQGFVGHLRSRLEESALYQQQRRTVFLLVSITSGLFVGLIVFLIGRDILQKSA